MYGLIHISMGGPELDIQVEGKIYHFEMHPYCGPFWLHKNGNIRKTQPNKFLHAVSMWAQQGKKMENGLCVCYHEPKEILKHLGGRHYQIMGYEPAVRGG